MYSILHMNHLFHSFIHPDTSKQQVQSRIWREQRVKVMYV